VSTWCVVSTELTRRKCCSDETVIKMKVQFHTKRTFIWKCIGKGIPDKCSFIQKRLLSETVLEKGSQTSAVSYKKDFYLKVYVLVPGIVRSFSLPLDWGNEMVDRCCKEIKKWMNRTNEVLEIKNDELVLYSEFDKEPDKKKIIAIITRTVTLRQLALNFKCKIRRKKKCLP